MITPNKVLIKVLKTTDLAERFLGKEESPTNEQIVSEDSFFEFHDRVKKEGARIIRCTQIDGGERGRRYHVVYLSKN